MTVHTTIPNLPVVDIGRFHEGPEERAKFIDELRDILHDHGFFYLTGHGVDPDLISEVVATARKFFALPLDEKLKIEMIRSPHFRGYNRAGSEHTRGEKDWREQLDINTEGEAVANVPEDQPWLHLRGPNQWPDQALPELKPLLLAYQAEVTRIGIDVLKAIAVTLGQPEDVFAPIYEPSPSQLLKIIRYPGRDAAESDQGVGAHKDGGFVTVLLQDTVPGLRVRTEEGEWIEAPPVPGTFVINTGELLELATNGFVRADVHDVVVPPAGVERFSVAFFLGARYDATIPVIDLPEELQRKERGISVDPLNPIFREVGINHLKSRLRSHPDVAEAHHAALVEKLFGKAG
ncbi:2-oxoglutarate and iron-dependent oxygenase domain-containing protein [Aquamicrobium lusatiense]|uniref:isopenicillin N synthase family dioxygenase n=1 Tax=Aquamicrobium lusatiense TaxID=89772 RepID=UPI002454D91C|nr:2-oxoglutarate and iron-dependent oxygenase domain-containing protein [Aquamicrobium lusatiense]MDH4990915.1 2-oxoglutarate and iron-dependent oxygenase domain-containing protein [Aquamicrobium lusatiense]